MGPLKRHDSSKKCNKKKDLMSISRPKREKKGSSPLFENQIGRNSRLQKVDTKKKPSMFWLFSAALVSKYSVCVTEGLRMILYKFFFCAVARSSALRKTFTVIRKKLTCRSIAKLPVEQTRCASTATQMGLRMSYIARFYQDTGPKNYSFSIYNYGNSFICERVCGSNFLMLFPIIRRPCSTLDIWVIAR